MKRNYFKNTKYNKQPNQLTFNFSHHERAQIKQVISRKIICDIENRYKLAVNRNFHFNWDIYTNLLCYRGIYINIFCHLQRNH